MIREKEIEQVLRRTVESSGGLCLKFISPGWDGAPDRVCLWPGGRLAFVEVKRPGEKPRPLQERRIAKLRGMGFRVEIIDSLEGATSFGPSPPEEARSFRPQVGEKQRVGGDVLARP